MAGTSPVMSKEDAVARVANMDSGKRSQQAIVDLMMGKGRLDKLVHQIPGGAHLTEQLDSSNLKEAVFTWLRRVRDFERYEISFAGDYDSEDDLKEKGLKIRRYKHFDFGWKAGAPLYWRKKGIKELANIVSTILGDVEDIVSVTIEREGIFVTVDTSKPPFSPDHKAWDPVLLITKIRST